MRISRQAFGALFVRALHNLIGPRAFCCLYLSLRRINDSSALQTLVAPRLNCT